MVESWSHHPRYSLSRIWATDQRPSCEQQPRSPWKLMGELQQSCVCWSCDEFYYYLAVQLRYRCVLRLSWTHSCLWAPLDQLEVRVVTGAADCSLRFAAPCSAQAGVPQATQRLQSTVAITDKTSEHSSFRVDLGLLWMSDSFAVFFISMKLSFKGEEKNQMNQFLHFSCKAQALGSGHGSHKCVTELWISLYDTGI